MRKMNFSRFYKVCSLSILFALAAGSLQAAEQPVSLSTKDGWALSAVYSPGSKGSTVVLLHDLGKNKAEFSSFRKALAKAGFGYLAIDLRGHGQSVSRGNYKSFAKEGADNPFNKMMQDALAAVAFLKSKGINEDHIILLGAGLGANVAAKTAGALPNLKGIALISPSANIRDVLPVPALRTYKGAVLIAASADERKGFLEASILRNVSFLTAGAGHVTFLTAYDNSSHGLLDKYLTASTIQWIGTPVRPDVLPDAKFPIPQHTWAPTETAPSKTNDLLPSVLME